MISQGYRLDACDISGCFWQDVDTCEKTFTMPRRL